MALKQTSKAKDNSCYITAFRSILFIFGSGILLAFIESAWGITSTVLSIPSPTWIRVIWIVVSVLLTLIEMIQMLMYVFMFHDDFENDTAILFGLMMFAIFLVATICILNSWLTAYSIFLLFSFAFMLVGDFYILSLAIGTETKTDAQKPNLSVVSETPGEKYCSVCKKSSLYEVCVGCERKHRKEIQRVRVQNARAKMLGEPATLTIAQWLEILENFQYRCAYCQAGPYEVMEHLIPVGQRHINGGTIEKNVVPACRACNARKSNKHLEK